MGGRPIDQDRGKYLRRALTQQLLLLDRLEDGKDGWAQYFVSQGYAVYVVDQVGRGRSPIAGREDGPVEEIRPGDILWFLPGEKHWRRATKTISMTHVASGGIERKGRRLDEKVHRRAIHKMTQGGHEQTTISLLVTSITIECQVLRRDDEAGRENRPHAHVYARPITRGRECLRRRARNLENVATLGVL
jgi:hypothetical protein